MSKKVGFLCITKTPWPVFQLAYPEEDEHDAEEDYGDEGYYEGDEERDSWEANQ